MLIQLQENIHWTNIWATVKCKILVIVYKEFIKQGYSIKVHAWLPFFVDTIFDLITAPALITAPLTFFTLFSLIITDLTIFVLTFYFIFTYRPLDDLLALVVENKFT